MKINVHKTYIETSGPILAINLSLEGWVPQARTCLVFREFDE
jgi:hypothetical protein